MCRSKRFLTLFLSLVVAVGFCSTSTFASARRSESSEEASQASKSSIVLSGSPTAEQIAQYANAYTPLDNQERVSAANLQAASQLTKINVMFDTRGENMVYGRLTINPAETAALTGDILTGVYAGTEETKDVARVFKKYYKNNVQVIYCAQDNFNMYVEIAAKAKGIPQENLHFYAYDHDTKLYTTLAVAHEFVDENGYVHFYTNTGGFLIVSDGPLEKLPREESSREE